jgi:high-affinity iron transporter
MVKSNIQSSLIEKDCSSRNILNNINSDILNPNSSDYHPIVVSTIAVLLNDTSKFYQLSNIGNTNNSFSQIDYENAIGMVDISHKLYKNISKLFSESKQLELESFFGDLKNSLSQKSDPQIISQLITAIQTNIIEEESNIQTNDSLRIYFGNIKNLLSKIIGSIKDNSDYSSAEKYATTAYLDNFEYIEAPLEKVNPELMNSLEKMMREELRELIRNEQQSQTIVLVTNITNNFQSCKSLECKL